MTPTIDATAGLAPARHELDRKLVLRALRGDRPSLDRLFATRARRFYNLSYRTCLDRRLAAVNTAQAFAMVARRLPELKISHGSFELLLLTAVAGRSLDAASRAAAPRLSGPLAPEPPSAFVNPGRAADQADRQLMLRSAVARLVPRQRKLLAMRDGAGFICADIAIALGEPERAVAGSLARARLRLLQELRLAGHGYGAMGEACAGALPLLALHADGDVEGSDLLPLAEHLEDCESCATNLAAMREARDIYASWLDLAPPIGLCAELELPAPPRLGALTGARYATARRVAAGAAAFASAAVIVLSAAVSTSIEPSAEPPSVAGGASQSDRDSRESSRSSNRRERSGTSGSAETADAAPATRSAGPVSAGTPAQPAPERRASPRRAPGDGGAPAGTAPGGSETESTDDGLEFTEVVIGRPVTSPPESEEPQPGSEEDTGGQPETGGGLPGPPGD